MSEGGKQSFAQFAADQNFPGVELDNTRRWNSGFKKVAVSPEHHRRRGTSTPPEVASERYLKAPRRGEIYEGRKATGRSDYAKARSESARNTPTVRPTGERPDLASPRSEGHSGKSKGHDARDRRRESNSQDLHVSGSQPSRRRRRRAKVERTPTPSSSYSDDLASEDPLHPESNSREGKPLEDEAAFHPSKMAPGFKQGIFAKAAVEPPFGSSGSPEVEPLGESAPSKFQKRAESPVLPRDAITPFKPADPVKPILGEKCGDGNH